MQNEEIYKHEYIEYEGFLWLYEVFLTDFKQLNPTPQKQVQRKRDVFRVRLGHLETKNFMLCMQLASLTRKRRRSVNET